MDSPLHCKDQHPDRQSLYQVPHDPFVFVGQQCSQEYKGDTYEQNGEERFRLQHLTVLLPLMGLYWQLPHSELGKNYLKISRRPITIVYNSRIHRKATVSWMTLAAASHGMDFLVSQNISSKVSPVCQFQGKMTYLPLAKVQLNSTIISIQIKGQQQHNQREQDKISLASSAEQHVIYAIIATILYNIQEMAESTKPKSTVKTELDEWGRKKFTIEDKSQSEEEQQPQIAEGNGHKSLLIGRQQNLNIQKYVGRIQKNKRSKKREVFFCEVCNEGFKCDLAYITHLNSPQHNRKLGMSMKVKAVSTQAVVEKLKNMKKGVNMRPEEREMARFLETAFVKKENKYMKEENQAKEEEEQNEDEVLKQGEEQEEKQDDVQAEMRALGLPTAFGSKKNKR